MSGAIISALIVLGAVFFFAVRKKITDDHGPGGAGYILIPCTSQTENLERLVKSYYWEEVFENDELARRILLVQMEKSRSYYTAKMLEQKYSIVVCLDISELADYLKRNELKCAYKSGNV